VLEYLSKRLPSRLQQDMHALLQPLSRSLSNKPSNDCFSLFATGTIHDMIAILFKLIMLGLLVRCSRQKFCSNGFKPEVEEYLSKLKTMPSIHVRS